MEKTNALRILDLNKILYTTFSYDQNITDGEVVAKILNEEPDMVFKTLVTVGNDLNHYVFCVPVNEKLDLKKAAKAVGVKNIEMIKQKDLFSLTGYIHGGCSPVGMKKQFVTVFNDTALLFDEICVSAGKVGLQMKIKHQDVAKLINARYEDII